MKNLIKIFAAVVLILSTTLFFAQSKNLKTETLKIHGNCDMCKATIEKAGNKKNIAKVEWNKDSKMATLTYDEKQTTKDEILKRIALAGYDSESFLAPTDVYEKLPECCHYERALKSEKVTDHSMHNMENKTADGNSMQMQESPKMPAETNMTTAKNSKPLSEVFVQYFNVKDALVATNSTQTSTAAKALNMAIANVKMGELNDKEHIVWMEILKSISADSKMMIDMKDIEKQRATFISLSQNFYKLSKVTNLETPTYYQHCPMADNGKGANWLSKENVVKNPYYGSMMLSCGKTVETIQ